MPEDTIKPVGYWDPTVKVRLILRDGFACYYCGEPFDMSLHGWDGASVDHVVPQAVEEKHEFENLRLACTSCNSAKGKKQLEGEDLERFREERRVLRRDDERWVRMTIPFLDRLRAQGRDWPEPGKLADDLIGALQTMGFFSRAERYTRAKATTWIELEEKRPPVVLPDGLVHARAQLRRAYVGRAGHRSSD